MTTPKSPAEKVLARILDASQPHSLLCCGATAEQVGRRWHQQSATAPLVSLDPANPEAGLPLSSPPDLAIVTDTLEHHPRSVGEHLLGHLRNYGTHRIAALVPRDNHWNFTDFIALGFTRHAELESENGALTLYTYNLDTYNHKRAWNNPDNWANPEMWGKAWW
ncbi:DUF6231 family protein [Marinobacter sp. VGCF2001]|uniref:DUF6231 family protein n=1 Tax=Marinobacter sp. VGCF2001 TaxID=3417189 RepID=UPI003CF119DE